VNSWGLPVAFRNTWTPSRSVLRIKCHPSSRPCASRKSISRSENDEEDWNGKRFTGGDGIEMSNLSPAAVVCEEHNQAGPPRVWPLDATNHRASLANPQ
jgi:hypothetical protein